MANTEDVPPWMVCEDIITRLKEELILEAIDILHEEMKNGRIDIKGYVSLLPEKNNEIQRDMYIINNLRMREAEMIEQYRPYLGEIRETDPEKIRGIEDLKKFMLAVGSISTLMKFSEVAETWAEDTGRHSEVKDKVLIMSDTLKKSHDRIEVLDFALSRSKFVKSEALTHEEMEILKKALDKVKDGTAA